MRAETRDMHQPDQARTITLLSDPGSYEHACATVKRIDTHGAIIFLAGEYAYKIKRAVRYDYMDFSSLSQRERVCRREIELNQPAAPQLYLGLVPITQEANGTLKIDGPGLPVEWAIQMRRFDDSALLMAIARQGELSAPLAKATAIQILEFHRQAPRSYRCEAQLDDVVRNVCGFLESLSTAQLERLNLPGKLCVDCCTGLRRFHHRWLDLLKQRANSGYVVRGHGDLHLSNIVVLDGNPLLFDALEFDESLATVDVLYDLAFLIMDLCVLDRRASANDILNRYLFHDGAIAQLDGLRLLPLFMALRAAVRAMVTIQGSEFVSESHTAVVNSRAADYLRFASRTLRRCPTSLIAVGGLSGSGKSTLARAMAPTVGVEPGAVHLRSDLERKAQWQVDETTRLPDDAYTPLHSDRVYESMLKKAQHALAAGHSVIVDAVFGEHKWRRAFADLADQHGARFHGLWLQAEPQVMRQRISQRRDDASDATVQVLDSQLTRIRETIEWHRINATGSVDDTLRIASEAVGRPDQVVY